MAFNGKWNLMEEGGIVAFYDAIKTPPAEKERLQKMTEAIKANPGSYYEELTVDGNSFHRKAVLNGEVKRDSGVATFNTEIDAKIFDGRPSKAKVVKESDTKLVRHDTVEGFNIKTTYEVSGDILTVTMCSGGATATEKYKRA